MESQVAFVCVSLYVMHLCVCLCVYAQIYVYTCILQSYITCSTQAQRLTEEAAEIENR